MWHFSFTQLPKIIQWKQVICNCWWHFTSDSMVSHVWQDRHWRKPEIHHHISEKKQTNKPKVLTLGRSVHSRQFSNLGWELRILGPISWFHFCCSQNPSPSSSTWWTEDLGGSLLISLKPATCSRKYQIQWYWFKQEHTVHLCKQLNQESKT